MCGIYGTTIPINDQIVSAKLDRIRFRGPDFSDFDRKDGVVLGHNRLAIIDLDPRSNQPYSYLHLRIVFNGEIYNYRALKDTLIKIGYNFNTSSDTEVICAAYLEYQEKCVEHFNGMFAFVIHDGKEHKLFGARDRLGKKPLYYYSSANGFEFASQPSQINLDKNLGISEEAINAYLHQSYITDQYCIFKNIDKLKAGHYFTYCLNSNRFQNTKYWDIDLNSSGSYLGTYADAKEALHSLITDSVHIRLNADVPLGIFLSGGIDSSLIASIAASENKNTKTFCIRFEDKVLDESVYAEKIAGYLGTDHHTITCLHSDGLSMLDNYSQFYDEPFADPSAIPLMLLAKYTKQHVTVALSGDGGDEGFLGYSRYDWMKLPKGLRKALSTFINLSPDYRHKLIALGLVQKDLTELYKKLCSGMDTSWLSLPISINDQLHTNILDSDQHSLLEKLSNYDIKTYLNDDINTKVDRATMSYALEARAPLMDYRVIEFANKLPVHFKMSGSLGQKRILKDLLYNAVPKTFFDRQKAGFTLPIKSWLRNELKGFLQDNLTLSALKDIPGLVPSKFKMMMDAHISGQFNYSSQIWSVLILKNWLDKHSKY
ncbi:MAG: asparagine synthase (glutamine-hydrolyzing) [Flavobacterium sp.]|nr:MAG: asparagine synthase (glutamine-hydrolyzing) [Flavobacterium sp.]